MTTWKCSNLACQRELDAKIQGTSGWAFCGECAAANELTVTGDLILAEQ